ncbi:predicted protein [Sclerotinia sclerotiorum 1980 UF-70]|uniref:Uncharacterized protein n=1 Tax=Sclerotinia sclerotiorum (strain ATCC 18683 / 1980 / Ss-1) TaxID=665079 RepID=A7F598_SCLS1|nr:predicted protein [Sclerotinia sclerotiorum 1980 UF-70]EDN97919.1 predicted protein [Sclerotinia sclerotiorum 1980 UF-70]
MYRNTPGLLRASKQKKFATQPTSKYITMINILSITIVLLSIFRSLISELRKLAIQLHRIHQKRDAAAQSNYRNDDPSKMKIANPVV